MVQRLKGWHSRGYLPHFDGRVAQFVTFRLFDSLPQTLLRQLEIETAHDKLGHYSREFQIKVEEYLDQGIGSCYLRHAEVAEMIRNALLFYFTGSISSDCLGDYAKSPASVDKAV